MTNSQSEAELETMRRLLIAIASRTERNSEKIDQLTDRLDRQTENLDRLGVKVDQLTENVAQQAMRMDEFRARMDADSVVMMAMLEKVVEVRQDSRRILDYLFGQQRNGNGD